MSQELSNENQKSIRLRPATLDDRRMIYDWLTNSDITERIMGPPEFIEHPVPTWEDFTADYTDAHFTEDDPSRGRSFIIELVGNPVGHLNHGELQPDGTTELDIWMAGSQYTGHGYGTEAILQLCAFLTEKHGCTRFIMGPSMRNMQAVRSYLKAGFEPTDDIPDWFVPDYADTVVMVKNTRTEQ